MALTKKQTIANLKQAAELIRQVHEGCEHTSRADNNSLFEIERYFQDIAKRVRKNYDTLEYSTMWWARR